MGADFLAGGIGTVAADLAHRLTSSQTEANSSHSFFTIESSVCSACCRYKVV